MKRKYKTIDEVEQMMPLEVLQELLKTKTYRQIGLEYDCNERTISELAKKYNIKKNYKVITDRNYYKSKSFNLDHILYLYLDEYKSCREIANIYNVNHDTIIKYLKNNGITIRSGYDKEYYKSRRNTVPTKILDSQGYIMLYINGVLIREHRYVMEQYLNRKLSSDEYVHHINFIKTDNEVGNLFLFESDSQHMLYHAYINKNKYISPDSFLMEYRDTINKITSYEYLYDLYITHKYSANKISKMIRDNDNLDYSRDAVIYQLKKHGIYDMRQPTINQYD